jgi:hypothetical protein
MYSMQKSVDHGGVLRNIRIITILVAAISVAIAIINPI